MTIQERMIAKSEREKDLLKYGRSQERDRIIKLLEESHLVCQGDLKCDACDEWQTFNETDYSFCEELFKKIKGQNK